jgi:acid stress-induced BolA-like protein IbaG/YrbA
MQPQMVKQMIKTGLPGAQVKSEEGSHFEAIEIGEAFTGQTIVKQHQMILSTLGNSIQSNPIHALTLKTYTSQEWEKLINNPLLKK